MSVDDKGHRRGLRGLGWVVFMLVASRNRQISWFRSSSRDGFAEIDGVDGAYYQLSADDIGSHICVKCSLASSHASLSPARQTNSRGGGRAGGAPAAVTPDGSRHQAVAFAEVMKARFYFNSCAFIVLGVVSDVLATSIPFRPRRYLIWRCEAFFVHRRTNSLGPHGDAPRV